MSGPGTGTKPASGSDTMAWAFQIEPRQDELLSGYLCRVARAHGASPYGFCELQLGDRSFWARDCDRGIVTRHEAVLAAQSGITAERLGEMTLRAWIGRLTPSNYRRAEASAVTPWVNAAGVFHRTRRQHALQFCQECLAETGTIFKPWRLSFVVMCPIHQTSLMDACPNCDAPFVPHRAPGRINLCHACQTPLARRARSPSGRTETNAMLLRLQGALIAKLDGSKGDDLAPLHGADMCGLREMMSAFFTQPGGRQVAEVLGVDNKGKWSAGPRLELARHSRRRQLVAACAVLLEQWPQSFRSVAERLHMTQRRIARYVVSRPEWLDAEIKRLPMGTKKSMLPSRRRRLLQVDRLEAERPANWRATRAAMLLRAARKPT